MASRRQAMLERMGPVLDRVDTKLGVLVNEYKRVERRLDFINKEINKGDVSYAQQKKENEEKLPDLFEQIKDRQGMTDPSSNNGKAPSSTKSVEEDPTTEGGRKRRKSRKSRKSRKTRKTRGTRKVRKTRKTRKTRKSHNRK
jgi:hypothetical protein